MKKLKTILFTIFLLSFVMMVSLLSGCEMTPGGTTPTKLNTPTELEILPYGNNHILFFKSVDNATQYSVRIYLEDGINPVSSFFVTETEKKEGVFIEGLANGDYEVAVKAYPLVGGNYLNSDESIRIPFTVYVEGGVSPTKYNVIFDTDGGTSITTQIVSEGNKAIKPVNPTKTGYIFKYWSLDGAEYQFDEKVTSNITLVAVWEEDKSGVITPELSPYYKSAEGLTGNALKAKLRTIISSNVKSTSYGDLRSYLPYTDVDPENSSNIILFYGQVSVKNSSSNWNREHVWPKSLGWFNESGAGSDVHHLRPEDYNVNSTRGNLPMGEVNGGKAVKYSNGVIAGYSGGGYFEPNDKTKGDVARIYFYMMIRYSQTDSSYKVTRTAQSLAMLLKWHEEDPVDEFEKVRNNRSYEKQGNRNPFIDYPEFAKMIFG